MNIMDSLSASVEDYLKNIFVLTEHGQPAATTALAEKLQIAPASVTGMLKKLAGVNPPLVIYRKHQGATLTPEGQRSALTVIRRHRLLETWLVHTLAYTWDEVHQEACRLEHCISAEFESRIAAALGNPLRDPHGDPIPNADLVMPTDTNSKPLSSLRSGQRGILVRVSDSNPEFLRYIAEIGLLPGSHITVTNFSPFDNNITVCVDEKPAMVLGLAVTFKILVELSPD
jgi:DtxR family transcriptional regulator, Mn-dependent transcriptional regulator